MPNCENCGNWVSHTFKRANSVDGEVKACPDCSTYRELSENIKE